MCSVPKYRWSAPRRYILVVSDSSRTRIDQGERLASTSTAPIEPVEGTWSSELVQDDRGLVKSRVSGLSQPLTCVPCLATMMEKLTPWHCLVLVGERLWESSMGDTTKTREGGQEPLDAETLVATKKGTTMVQLHGYAGQRVNSSNVVFVVHGDYVQAKNSADGTVMIHSRTGKQLDIESVRSKLTLAKPSQGALRCECAGGMVCYRGAQQCGRCFLEVSGQVYSPGR